MSILRLFYIAFSIASALRSAMAILFYTCLYKKTYARALFNR